MNFHGNPQFIFFSGLKGRRRRRITPIHVDVHGFRRMDDPTFSTHFRMNRITFEVTVPCFFIAGHFSNNNIFW